MADRGGAHAALRAGTAADHQRLDGLFAGFDLGDPHAYRSFLIAHAMALPAVEAALDQADFANLLPDWPERHRAAALSADLIGFGEPMPAPLPFPPLTSQAAQWGAAYVLEGSRLGGAMLARSVGDEEPKAYLGTPQSAGAWRMFLENLDNGVQTSQEIELATAAARSVFALFETAGRAQTEHRIR